MDSIFISKWKECKKISTVFDCESLSYLELYLGSQQNRNFLIFNLPENENRIHFQSAEVLLKITGMLDEIQVNDSNFVSHHH
jgi:hypothetical protein